MSCRIDITNLSAYHIGLILSQCESTKSRVRNKLNEIQRDECIERDTVIFITADIYVICTCCESSHRGLILISRENH